jgi:hypothetical protein
MTTTSGRAKGVSESLQGTDSAPSLPHAVLCVCVVAESGAGSRMGLAGWVSSAVHSAERDERHAITVGMLHQCPLSLAWH